METKPFNLQSPEQIAKDYGGNKQKIAEAMQMGILDPTAGTMAGMFIDRMRSAAQQEAAPQQTVAQQTFAPPAPMAPPAGLGATPQAAAMPPMGAPPEMGAAPPQGMPMMAEGGMVPPYASGGGLSDVPLPDGMFDEPSNGGFGDGYAGGGMVAFAAGAKVDADEDGDGNPDTYFGYNFKDPSANAAMRDKLFGVPETKYAKEFEADLLRRRSPEALGKLTKAARNMALIEAGIAMANTPGSILQAGLKGVGAALPGLKEAEKERRAEEREIQKGLIDLEQGRNTVAAQKAMQLIEMQRTGIQGREGQIGREFQEKQQLAGFAQAEKMSDKEFKQQVALLGMRGSGGSGGSGGSETGGKPMSDAQASERINEIGNRLEELAASVVAADNRNDPVGTQRKLEEWATTRNQYNRIASKSNYAKIGSFPKRLPNFEANYKKAGKKLPIQRQSVKRDKTLTYNPKTGKLEE
jgi:hypothetical protein